jgi:glutamine amidotransferase
MCRFALYLGTEIRVSALVTEPANSIIHQSFDSHERSEPLNGDGFGIAWYSDRSAEAPALFRSTTPAWSNNNLREIARITLTECLLAHIRAASPGLPVAEINCHPFKHGQLTFMHNGDLGGFQLMRRKLLDGLSDEAFGSIKGTTDSEHIFAVFLDRLEATPDAGSRTERLAQAMEATIQHVESLRGEVAPDRPALLNLVVCDGRNAVVARYTSGHLPANSLYFSKGRMYLCEKGLCHMEAEGPEHSAVLVVSEPLDEADHWIRVSPGDMLLVTPDLQVSSRAIGSQGIFPQIAASAPSPRNT